MNVDKKPYVADSFALLAYLGGEAAAQKVKAALVKAKQNKANFSLSVINFGEIIYIVERKRGLEGALEAISAIDQLPIEIVEADRELTFHAAHIKANYAISYADAFAVALAQRNGARLLTGDPEFVEVEELIEVEWLPK